MKVQSLLTRLMSGLALTASLLTIHSSACHAAVSPIDSLMKFAGNIHQFNSIFPQEKVYLQFDNTSYFSEETIWFKAFVVNASTLKRCESRVLYVDLLSPDGVLLKQQKLMIVAGQADGSLTLYDGATAQARDLRGGVSGYPSGFYEIRAYTNYMLNFNQDAIFSRVLAVYNKPKQEGHYYDENPTINIRPSSTKPLRPEVSDPREMNVSFYPEGGHMVIGQPCTVAFKVTGSNGLGIEAEGSMDDIRFSTMHDGMGSFTFTPDSRRNSVKFTAGGRTRTFSLPDAEKAGYTVQAEFQDQDNIKFTVHSSKEMQGQELGMTLTCRGELVDFATMNIQSRKEEHTFNLSQLPEGIIRFSLFNMYGDIMATRSFYHENREIGVPTLTVESDKESYAPFEKIKLSFLLSDGKGIPFRDRFCLSVRDSRGQANVFNDDLRTNFLMSSDLKGFIERPAYYFNPENADRLRDLDLLCMVQGWERYEWKTMAGLEDFYESHRLENGLTLNGWAVSQSGSKPLADVQIIAALATRDKTLTETYTYTTDETGYFGFDIGLDFYDKERFSIKAVTQNKGLFGSPARIMLDRAQRPAVRAYQPGETLFTGNSVLKSGGKTTLTDQDDQLPTVVNIETGFVLPDVEINEHRKYVDYYKFQAYDAVKDVELELDKGKFTTDVYGYLLEKGYDISMDMDTSGELQVLYINGLPAYIYAHSQNKLKDLDFESEESTMSPSAYASTIDMQDIKSLLVYDRPMYQREAWDLSPLYLSYLNKTIDMDKIEQMNDLSSASSPANKLVYMVDILLKEEWEIIDQNNKIHRNQRFTTVDGYSRPYSFYAPEYPNGPIPGDVDYRRTLYWNPNVITNNEGKAQVEFYNSSITKNFDVQAAGITASGVPYTLDAGF